MGITLPCSAKLFRKRYLKCVHHSCDLNLVLIKQIIGDVRGVGLFVGVDLVKDKDDGTREANPKAAEHILSRMKEEKILAQSDGPYNNVLKLKPPLVFNKSDADRFANMLDQIIDEITAMDQMIS